MQTSNVERFAPLAGVAFLALAVAAFAVGGETPDVEDSTAKVVAYWNEHDADRIVSAVLGGFAAVALVWFGGSLRRVVFGAEGGDGRLAALAFAGAVIAAVGLLLFAGFSFAAADTVGDVPGEVTQTLSVLSNDFFFPLAGGIALMLLASGVAFIRTRVVPGWLGWLTLVLGFGALTPVGFFVFLAAILWIAGLGVAFYVRAKDGAAAG